MNQSHRKIFRDPVHGNIEVDGWICEEIIDTTLFQRLRYVEQSSIGLLFPGARHNRFVHSIGVYFVAEKICNCAHSQLIQAKFKRAAIRRLLTTFKVAALLHDCAHSPFSHTGEMLSWKYCKVDFDVSFEGTFRSRGFRDDYYAKDVKENLHFHELASAYVGAKTFAKVFNRKNVDREQFARMIIGLRNRKNIECSSGSADRKRLLLAYNCFIELLNGFVIDADRLDYLLRDTWASGICNSSVDLDRLISGLVLDFDAGSVRVHQKSLSSLANAVTARDYIYKWILPHHKVAYANVLLTRAMESLVAKLAESEADHSKSKQGEKSNIGGKKKKPMTELEVGAALFSPDRLLEARQCMIAGERISFPTDGDILYLMKKYISDDKYANEYLSRRREFVSLWKSYAEFAARITEPFNQETLKHKGFWKLVDKALTEYCKKDPRLLWSGVLPMKQTSGEMQNLSITGSSANYIKPSTVFQHSSMSCQYFYVFLNHPLSEDEKEQNIKKVHEIFGNAINEYQRTWGQ